LRECRERQQQAGERGGNYSALHWRPRMTLRASMRARAISVIAPATAQATETTLEFV